LRYEKQKGKRQSNIQGSYPYGYTLKEIAEHMGVHYTTVSRAINRIEEK